MNIQAINFNTPFLGKNAKYDLMQKNELIDCIRKGYTQKDIAEIFNVPQHVVTRAINTFHISPKRIKHAERRINTLNRPLK